MSEENQPADPPSTGFVVIEGVLHEFRDRKRSLTLEKWSARVKQGIEQYLAANSTPKAAKDAQAVQNAFAAAVELIETMRKEGAKRKPS